MDLEAMGRDAKQNFDVQFRFYKPNNDESREAHREEKWTP